MEETSIKLTGPSASSMKKKRHFPFLFQLILVIAFLSFVYFSFGQNVLSPQKQSDVPVKLGRLELVSNVQGKDALAQVSRLHGTDIVLKEANILQYAHKDPYHNENAKVTVWIGKAENSSAAADLMQRMTSGIVRGGSGFRNLQRMSVGGDEILKVDGPGGNHYFYIPKNSQEKVIWLIIENSSDSDVLELAVKVF